MLFDDVHKFKFPTETVLNYNFKYQPKMNIDKSWVTIYCWEESKGNEISLIVEFQASFGGKTLELQKSVGNLRCKRTH